MKTKPSSAPRKWLPPGNPIPRPSPGSNPTPHAGKVLTHRALLGAVWGGENTEQTEYLRVFVAQLRKKLEPSPNSPRYIVTDPWVGYRFEPGD